MKFKLSLIIPTHNETHLYILEDNLKNYSLLKEVEIICVDGGSTDHTVDLIKSYPVKLIQGSGSRSDLLNIGIQAAQSDYILLNHPRSSLSIETILKLIEQKTEMEWGALTHEFDQKHFLLNFTSWYSNKIRGDIFGIFYLDHCIFGKKSLFEDVGLFPSVEIFEDTEISKKLLKLAKPSRLKFISKTSAIRFNTNGVLKQALLNQVMKLLYYSKIDHQKMNKFYEWGLNLNTKKKSKSFPVTKKD
ncbi:MAG: GT2 family glycosyltransferase [Thermoproteota archaeon]|jgi:GT2 family glycosyltransferase